MLQNNQVHSVVSSQALYHFCEAARVNPEAFRGSRILFWHTGGQLSMYEKAEQLMKMMPMGQVQVSVYVCIYLYLYVYIYIPCTYIYIYILFFFMKSRSN